MCILVVEDEPLVRMSVEDCLEDAGREFMSAENAHDAIKVLAAHPGRFTGLITDFSMAFEVTGADLIEQMRPSYPAVPMVLATAIPTATTQAWRHRHRVRLVVKPYNPAELVGMMERLLSPL